jgi:hypothetical protein
MKKILSLLALCLLIQVGTHAQGFLKRLKDKAEKKVENAIDKKIDGKTGNTQSPSSTSTDNNSSNNQNNGSTSNNSSNRPSNKTGAGLQNSAVPDVAQQITDIDKAYTAGNFSDARFAIQQALLGVELQLGKQLLQSLPNEISGLPKDTLQDKVISTHWGWDNMNMQRVYVKDDKQLTITIGNNTAYVRVLDMYFNNAYLQNSNSADQKMKQIKIKNNKAIIKYDDHEGYTVLIKIGQTGLITCHGINFSNEQEITAAINTIDIDSIKKILGEQ